MAYGMSTKQRKSSLRRLTHYKQLQETTLVATSILTKVKELEKVLAAESTKSVIWEPSPEMQKLHQTYRGVGAGSYVPKAKPKKAE